MKHITILLTLLLSIVGYKSYSQQTLYSFSSTPNTWSLTDGGANCSCSPTVNDTVIISHNWANPAFYPLTHPANIAFGTFLTGNPIKVVVRSGGVVYQQGTIPTGMILDVKTNGIWAFNGSVIFQGTDPNTIALISNNGSILVNGSYSNKMDVNSVGEFCKNGTFTQDITVPASFNGITDQNLDPYFDYQNYGAWCMKASPLPVELVFFTNKYDTYLNTNVFSWITATELNNDYFELLLSNDLKEWYVVTTINGNGNSSTPILYEYNYYNNNNYIYAKLRQTDYDGKQTDSHIITVNNKDNNKDKLYVNVNVDNIITINNNYTNSKPIPVILYDMNGKKLYESIINKGITNINIEQVTNDYKGMVVIKVGYIIKKTFTY